MKKGLLMQQEVSLQAAERPTAAFEDANFCM